MIKIYTILLLVLFTISCQVAPVQKEQPRRANPIAINSENAFSGKVVGIADGDTATVLDDANAQHKIRFLGGKISDRTYRKFWEKLGKRGYRLNEPIELEPPQEKPSLFKELVDYHLEELQFSVEDLSYITLVSPTEFSTCYLPQETSLRLVA